MKPRGRPFEPGNKFGKGRPKGSRNRMTKVARELFEQNSPVIANRCLQLALNGDKTAIRLCLERAIPPARGDRISINLPEITTAAGTAEAQGIVLHKLASGKLSPGEAEVLSNLIERRRHTIETVELVARVEVLEKRPPDDAESAANPAEVQAG